MLTTMTNQLPPKFKGYLLLAFGLWLIVLQSITFAHAAEHALEADNTHCLYSNVYHDQSAGPTSNAIPVICPPQTENIAAPLYLQPSLAWQRNLQVRAPPL
jgi:hypothetical protein